MSRLPMTATMADRAVLFSRLHTDEWAAAIQRRADRYTQALRAGGTLYFIGNGGSAATCQHVAAEYVGRFRRGRRPYRAVALTTDTSVLTAIGNDYGYPVVFSRQLVAFTRPDDLLVIHSTSGEGLAIQFAVNAAACPVVAMLGRDGGLLAQDDRVDSLVVPSDDTALIQEAHLAIEHIICGLVEAALEGDAT
jgi:D-sedoheptulose 7-phosphate isomerase